MGSSRVLVTGSSRGIGRAIARSLAEAGWQVALHGSHPGKDLEESERAVGNQAAGSYAADLSDPSRADSLLAQVVADGPLHALVNNAGVYLPLDFTGASEAVFETNLRKTFAVNFEAPVRLIRAAIPHFRVQGGGKVLNVSSRVGFKGEAEPRRRTRLAKRTVLRDRARLDGDRDGARRHGGSARRNPGRNPSRANGDSR